MKLHPKIFCKIFRAFKPRGYNSSTYLPIKSNCNYNLIWMLFPKRPEIQLFICSKYIFLIGLRQPWLLPPLQHIVCFNCASVNSLTYRKLKITISHIQHQPCLIWENKNDHHKSFCKSLMMENGSKTSSHTSNTQRMCILDAIGVHIHELL